LQRAKKGEAAKAVIPDPIREELLEAKRQASYFRTRSGGDFASILRTALLLAFVKDDQRATASFLKEAAAQPRTRTRVTSDETPEMVQRYTQLCRTMASAVSGVEAEVFEQAASNLKPGSKRRA
jgi:hypothetical protein